ncbi:hypothetical protein J6590_066696 [Homalodisca vitripennis]|nr:hypothetical protein J6590_066696 [Homalodisca vitripennis]
MCIVCWITTSLSSLKPRVSTVEQRVMDIGDRVDSIESGIASNVGSAKSLAGSSQVDVSLVVEEVNERLLRSKNIMIFGLPESLMTNPNEKRDKRNIEAILSSADPNSNSSSLRFFRVGKGSASKPRPLKIIIGCAERVNKILKACTKDVIRGLGSDFSNISLARDKTKQELAHLDPLRKELSRRLKEGTMGSINPLIQRPQYVHDTRKCNLENVKNEILGGAIVIDYDCKDVNCVFSSFCSQLGNCIKLNSPLKRVGSSSFPKWFTKELKDMVVLKKILHAQYKKTLTDFDYCAFSSVRDQCKILSRASKANYVHFVDSAI